MLLILSIFLCGTIVPISQALNVKYTKGFDKGLSYTSVVPIEKTTFVEFNEDELYDDYAYLAALPTAVFRSNDRLYSHPLLFYQDKIDIEEEDERILDSYPGIHYFMEDWMSYCKGKQDQMTLINVDENKVSKWGASDVVTINSEDPYEISRLLALQDWEYSNDAVVAVIDEEFIVPDNIVSGETISTLSACKTEKQKLFTIMQTNSLNPVSEYFTIGENFKQLFVECWWDGVIVGGKMMPAGDPDFQTSFKNGDDWMYANVASDWNINEPIGREIKQTYVYQPGDWRITVTDYPTKGNVERKSLLGGFFEIIIALVF